MTKFQFLWQRDQKTVLNFELLDIQIIGVMALNTSSNWLSIAFRLTNLWIMLIAKVVQRLIMIVFMKTAKPVSTCPSDISFKKLYYARYNKTN